MSYPFDQISASEQQAARSGQLPGDRAARLGAHVIAAPGRPGAVLCQPVAKSLDGRAPTRDLLHDWSGSFDMHLGVYTSD